MDISFQVGQYHLGDHPTRRALVDTFSVSMDHLILAYNRKSDLYFLCSDAQYGQFIARRVVYGCKSNQVQNLNTKIICDPRPTVCEPVFQTKFDTRTDRC